MIPHGMTETAYHMLCDRISAAGHAHNRCWASAQQLMCD